jgi:hypothetical protein
MAGNPLRLRGKNLRVGAGIELRVRQSDNREFITWRLSIKNASTKQKAKKSSQKLKARTTKQHVRVSPLNRYPETTHNFVNKTSGDAEKTVISLKIYEAILSRYPKALSRGHAVQCGEKSDIAMSNALRC